MKTRKNKLRNLLKLGILCFGISLLLFSCEKDTIIEKDTVSLNSELLSNINESTIPLSDLEYENNITQILNKPLKRKGSTLKSRSTNNIFSSFKDLPLEDKVIKYNVNNYTSYSIAVKQELSASDFFQNIVIEKDNLKEAVYLISYYPDVNYQKLIKENKMLFGNDFTGSINIEYLYYKDKNKTTKSNSNRKVSAKGTTGISDPFPLCAELHVPGRTCTAGGKHVHGQTCKGTRSQQPTAPYVIKVCTPSSMNGGGEVTTPNDIPEKCINCPDTSPSGPTTGGVGGPKTTKSNPTPWVPKYICVSVDPSTGACSKVELNTPVISQPVVPNNSLKTLLNLTPEEEDWLNDGENIGTKNDIEKILEENNNSEEAKKYVKGQIKLEILTQKIPWKASKGTIEDSPNLRFTHVYHNLGKGISYFKMEDGSIVTATSSEQKVELGGLVDKYRDNAGISFNVKYYYIKLAKGEPWAEMLFDPKNTGDELRNLFFMAGKDLGKNIGRFVLPIEDIKILIDGKDFDGQDVARWKAAGGLLLTVVPGGKFAQGGVKVLKIVDKISDSSKAFAAVARAGEKTISFGTRKLGEVATVLKNARKLAGKAKGIGVKIKGKWLKGTHGNAGFFPKSIADKMKNKTYKNFDEFRKDFWENVAADSNLSKQFKPQNISLMKKGKAPIASNTQWVGKTKSYQLHHKTPINRGGAVYDMDNLTIVTPKYHKEILLPEYHYGYGY